MTIYYVSDHGSDLNNGTSALTPWQTQEKVSAGSFSPGDEILFRRGDIFRGRMFLQSGDVTANIKYGAYGVGELPKIYGSKDLSSGWTDLGSNLWASPTPEGTGGEILTNPSFETDLTDWGLALAGTGDASLVRDTTVYDSSPASAKVTCVNTGGAAGDIKLYTCNFGVSAEQYYVLSFRAKSTIAFDLYGISIADYSSPNPSYAWSRANISITASWQTFTVLFKCKTTDTSAAIIFYLGTVLPNGAEFNIDSLSFKTGSFGVYADAGNLIFNNDNSCGVKKTTQADCISQGDFYDDKRLSRVVLYSVSDPASFYDNIECAIKEESNWEFDSCHHITIENLCFKYMGANPIKPEGAYNITIQDCDFGWIGGSYQGTTTVRYGNAISMYNDAHDIIVQRNRFWECYDEAYTSQGVGDNTNQYNIYVRNNIMWNCEIAMTLVFDGIGNNLNNIYYEYNTILNSGNGWCHAQRPDPKGRGISCYGADYGTVTNIFIRNNIIYQAEQYCWYVTAGFPVLNLISDYNCFYEATGNMIYYVDTAYTMAQFSTYQSAKSQDAHSLAEDPSFLNSANLNTNLKSSSNCIGGALNVNITDDYIQKTRPQQVTYDIGAVEYMEWDLYYIDNFSRKQIVLNESVRGWIYSKVRNSGLGKNVYLVDVNNSPNYEKNILLDKIIYRINIDGNAEQLSRIITNKLFR